MPPKAVAGCCGTCCGTKRQAERDNATERAEAALRQEAQTGELKSWKIQQLDLKVKNLMAEISRLENQVVCIRRERDDAVAMTGKYFAMVSRQRQRLHESIEEHCELQARHNADEQQKAGLRRCLDQCYALIGELRTKKE